MTISRPTPLAGLKPVRICAMKVIRKMNKYPLLVARESVAPFKKEAAQRIRKDNPNRITMFNADSEPIAVVNSDRLFHEIDGNQNVIPDQAMRIRTTEISMAV